MLAGCYSRPANTQAPSKNDTFGDTSATGPPRVRKTGAAAAPAGVVAAFTANVVAIGDGSTRQELPALYAEKCLLLQPPCVVSRFDLMG